LSIYLLSESSFEGVVNLPLIKSTCNDIDVDLSAYDALIFTSKNGVRAIDKINQNWKEISSYAIGKPTADEVDRLDGSLEFIAKSSYGDDFANELKVVLKGKKVLFLRAKIVLSNLEGILRDEGIDINSIAVYDTTCNDELKPKNLKKKSIIIFTSPSTIECFFKYFQWDDTNIAVCIGSKTLSLLPKYITSHMSKEQTIISCIELAKSLKH